MGFHTVSPAPIFVRILGTHHLGTWLRLVPGWWDSRIRTKRKTYLICITAQVLENYFDTPLLAYCVRWRQCELQLKVETCDQEPSTQPTTITNTNTSAFNDTSRHLGDKKLNSTSFVVVVISIPHKLHLLPVHCCWVQMLDGANWHEAPRKSGLFTFWL